MNKVEIRTWSGLIGLILITSFTLIVGCGSGGGDGGGMTGEYKTWTHPSGLSDNISPDGQGAYSPQVAMGNNGQAVITWCQSDGSNYQIFKSEYRNGVWTHPSGLSDNISPDGSDTVGSAYLAMDDNGQAIITWYQSDGSNDQIYKSEYRNGVWTHPSGPSDNISLDGQDACWPQVAMDNNGQAIITWFQFDGSNDRIFKSEYRNDVWIYPSGLSDNISPEGSDAGGALVAMDNNGNAIIAWCQPDANNSYQAFKSEYRNGVWTHPSGLSDNISPDSPFLNDRTLGLSAPVMDDNGNAIIAWYQDGNIVDHQLQIFMSEYRNSTWTHPSDLDDNIGVDDNDANGIGNPDAAMDNNGNAVITWPQYFATIGYIFKSEYRNGAWTHPASTSDGIVSTGSDISLTKVAMDDNGNAIITWSQNDGSNFQIFMSEYR